MQRGIIIVLTAVGVAIASPGTAALGAVPPQAESRAKTFTVPVTDATLTWAVSECAFDATIPACGSLTEARSQSGAVEAGETGWVWTGGSGTFNQKSGASNIRFNGSITMGNVRRGGYSITFSNLRVAVNASGNGRVSADLAYRESANAPLVEKPNVLLVRLPSVGLGQGWEATPPWEGVGTPGDPAPIDGAQFAQPLLDALPESLKPWFWKTATGASINPFKQPSPITLAAERQYRPMLIVSPSKSLRIGKATKVRVEGYGFDPSLQGAVASGIYVVFGPNAAAAKNGYTNTRLYETAQYLPQGPDRIGKFRVELNITGRYKVDKRSYNGLKSALGFSTWAAHNHPTTAWDSFLRVKFKK